jgi:hypothetical protein
MWPSRRLRRLASHRAGHFLAAAVAVRRDVRSVGVRGRCDSIAWAVVQAGRWSRPHLRCLAPLPRHTAAERHHASRQTAACSGNDQRRGDRATCRPAWYRRRDLLESTVAVHRLVGNARKWGVSVAFILLNSASGLGNVASLGAHPSNVWLWSGIVVVGGLIGSELGSRRVAVTTFRRLLAAVLFVAGLKLLFFVGSGGCRISVLGRRTR